jgi:hypothetical protein
VDLQTPIVLAPLDLPSSAPRDLPIYVKDEQHQNVQCMRCNVQYDACVRNRILTLIEREDDTRSWGNFLVYFSHNAMPT